MTLALMYLVMHGGKDGARAWKGFEWATMDRLHEKGFIGDPKGKARSVLLTETGTRRSEELFRSSLRKSAGKPRSSGKCYILIAR